MMMRLPCPAFARFVLCALAGACLPSHAAEPVTSATPATAEARRYTFSWPVGPDAPAPRGGTTRGPQLALDTAPSPQWLALQAPGLSAFERDRRAILAMAGSYRVTFDFLEVAAFNGEPRPRPYQSWGTERVFVDRDTGREISLVHILEMRIVGPDGQVGEPMVTKHWRQDWRFEPESIVAYDGGERWSVRRLDRAGTRGAWSQSVYQVDESPRYASVGRWRHNGSFSAWDSGETARPLPRREWSVRKDYQLLTGTNRHTIVPTGWLQEEDNLKQRRDDARLPFVGREYGVARYERLKDADFTAAESYYRATRAFWNDVLAVWNEAWARHDSVQLKANSDQSGEFAQLFELAEAQATSPADSATNRARIRDVLAAQGVPR
jgi:hypothetical protein